MPLFNRNYIFHINSLPSVDYSNDNISLNISNNLFSECDSLKCFLQKIKYKSDPLNFYLNEETIDFKFNFYKYISNLSFNHNHNLSISEIESLKSFSKNKPFKVAECDKNVGVCLISNDNYNTLCLSLLNDINTYEHIPTNPLNLVNEKIKISLDNLLLNKDISKQLYEKLFTSKNKLGSFRILTKLHKDEFSLRPIVNCRLHPTSNISLLVNLILQNFVKQTASFLLDSQNLIQKIYRKFYPKNCKLFSCDFSSLYTAINLAHALDVITEFLSRHFKSKEISILGIRTLLDLIFKLNFFRFGERFYKQKEGIAMGNIAAPSIANIYLAILEQNFLNIHADDILAYYRFIDDIFIIVKKHFNINFLKFFFGYLKLNVVGGKTVNFLDLNISLNPITYKLKFNLFVKPTFTYSYVRTDSNHPPFIFKNIPKSVFFRIRRICSNLSDYLYHSFIFSQEFIKKGYDQNNVHKCARMVSNLDRNSIIPYKKKLNKFDFYENLFFKLPFNFNYLNVEKFFQKYNKDSDCFSSFFNNYSLKLIYSMNSNLSKILTHNFPIDKHFSFKFTKCLKRSCNFCPLSNNNSYLKLNNFYLPMMCNSNCRATNIIYIIYCSKCFHYYIGQTNNLRRRFNKHKNKIIRNDLRIDTEINDGRNVVKHFNTKDHCVKENFRFFIFKNNIEDLSDRLNIETQLIHLFLKLDIPILNEKITDMFKYRKHTYLFK